MNPLYCITTDQFIRLSKTKYILTYRNKIIIRFVQFHSKEY